MTSRTLVVSLTAATGFVVLFANDNLLSSQQSNLIAQANAEIGRPLTPGSVAGVARRTERRAYRRNAIANGAAVGTGSYYGAAPFAAGAAIGTGALAGAAYYGNGPYYGTGLLGAGVERRMERRAIRRAYYANGGSYPGYGAYASGAYNTDDFALGMYRHWNGVANVDGYPLHAVYTHAFVPGSYYGPECNPRFDKLCQ